MKVQFNIRGEVTYRGELEMTEDEYQKWSRKVDTAIGSQRNRLAEDLISAAGMTMADPSDWGDLDIDEFVPE
jgi:hypothetical protein